MNQVNLPPKGARRPIGKEYLDSQGKKQIRASNTDFETLFFRQTAVISNLPGFQDDKELVGWLSHASNHYDTGEYSEALQYLSWSLKKMPALEPYIFYYIKVCERIVAVPLTKKEEVRLARYNSLPKWLKWTMPGVEDLIRCKWCGRYNQHIDSDEPTFGLATLANSCMSCGQMYPMPSWMWDSPDGRAYSYYRKSFSDKQFYEEFEQDYDPEPLVSVGHSTDSGE